MPKHVPPMPPGLRAQRAHIGDEEVVVFSWALTARVLPEHSRLTPAERAVGALLLDGSSYAEVAAARGRSPRTISKQISSLYRKLGVSSRRELWALAGEGPISRG